MKVNLGSGPDIRPGWLNIDILPIKEDCDDFIQWDLTVGLPHHVNDIHLLYNEHFTEHLTLAEALNLYKDCYGKMREGGVVRIGLPNFRQLVTKYLNNDWDFFSHCLNEAPNRQMMEIINFALYQRDINGVAEHKTMYDVEYACFMLTQAGFKDCKEVEFNPMLDSPSREKYTFYVSGCR